MRGRAKFSRNYDDMLELGKIVLLPRGTPAAQHTSGGECGLLLLNIDSSFLGSVGLERLDMDPAHVELAEQYAVWDRLAVEIGVTLIGLRDSHNPSDNLYAESLIHTLALHSLRQYGVFPAKFERLSGGLSLTALRRVKDYIHQHPGNDLTLADLSKLANFSVCHFSTLFKASTGQSVHQYVLEQRIAEAKQLVLTSSLALAEIADAVGFADQSHFTRTFKRIVGTTPGALQKHRKFVQNPRKNLQDQDA